MVRILKRHKPGTQGTVLQAIKTHCQWNQLSQHLCVFPVNEKDEETRMELSDIMILQQAVIELTLGILFWILFF